ncbi:TolC family protein [Piscinibacter terrae]|uniref:TolC family protein n=1 Tax=Piscinibacter terrae TaxID=2496871 RepID=UPI0013867A55|nr:TolC family protein [Albitalea terrae]
MKAQTPAAWRETTASAEAAKVVEPDLDQWWRAFGDEQLDAWVIRARGGNLSIAAAAQRVRAARSMLQASQAGASPVLRFDTSAIPSPDSRRNYFIAGFDAQWEAGLFGRTAAEIDAAQADAQTASADLKAARVAVVAEVVRTWLGWRHSACRQALLADSVSVQERRLALWQSRVSVRQASQDDVARARRELEQLRLEAWEASTVVAGIRSQMAVLAGDHNATGPDTLPCTRFDLPAVRISQLPADIIRTRPDIQRAEHQVMKAFGSAREAEANRHPRLSLNGTLSVAVPLSGAGSTSHGILSAAPFVDIPLFDAGARQAVSQARLAQMQAAVLDYRQSVLEGIAEVESAMASLSTQRERRERLSAMERDAEQLALRAEQRFRLKQADRFDLEDSQEALIKSRLATLDAELAQQLAFVRLYKALGGANPMADEARVQAMRDAG